MVEFLHRHHLLLLLDLRLLDLRLLDLRLLRSKVKSDRDSTATLACFSLELLKAVKISIAEASKGVTGTEAEEEAGEEGGVEVTQTSLCSNPLCLRIPGHLKYASPTPTPPPPHHHHHQVP